MRADICDSSDDKAVEKFRATLKRLGAQLEDKSWAIGVDLYRLEIGNEKLSVFCDEHHGLLASMAHVSLELAAGLPVHPARRQPRL